MRSSWVVLVGLWCLVVGCGGAEPEVAVYPGALHLEEEAGGMGQIYLSVENQGSRSVEVWVETDDGETYAIPERLTLERGEREVVAIYARCPRETGSYQRELRFYAGEGALVGKTVELSLVCHPSPDIGSGSLGVSFRGLPPGARGSLTVEGPRHFEARVTEEGLLEDLAPGRYFFWAHSLEVGGHELLPGRAFWEATVYDGDELWNEVTYEFQEAEKGASVELVPAGLPEGFAPTVEIRQGGGLVEAALPAAISVKTGAITFRYPLVVGTLGGKTARFGSVSAPREAFLFPGDVVFQEVVYQQRLRVPPEEENVESPMAK